MALSEPPSAYRFGDFVLDPQAFRLSRKGEAVKLEPKAFDVLLCLLQRPGEVVSRHDLVADAWKGIAITDNAVARVVANLRRALDDHPDRPRYIETVPTRGYRLICDVLVADHGAEDARPDDKPGATAALDPGAVQPRRRVRLVTWIAGVIVLVFLILLGVAAARRWAASASGTLPGGSPAAAAASSVRTLAVLPLRNLTGDPSQDYVADGMTQAISDRFSELGVVGVVSITSSMRYRNAQFPANRIAAELNADALVEGAVVARSGDRVRVSVSLVDGRTGHRVWTGQYNHSFADVLALYDEIAVSAAGEAKLAVDAVNATRRARRAVNPEAYDEYLRAMKALGNRWMAGGCREAEPRLLNVVERDRSFAPALAALAWCYAYPDRLGRNVSEVAPKAKAAVSEALALDDRLALAHAVQGTIKWRVDYDVAAGEAALGRALERDPNSGLVLIPSAEILLWRGQVERGLALLDRAIRLDPLSPDRNVQVGFSLLMIGRYAAAIERFERALAVDPQYLTARYWLAEALGYEGKHDRAVAEYLAWLDGALLPELAPAARRRFEAVYARGGWPAFWLEDLNLAKEEGGRPGAIWGPAGQNRFTSPWYMARRLARLGRTGEALDALELAHKARHHLVATLAVEPLFVSLRQTPRFQSLLRQTGAVPVSPE